MARYVSVRERTGTRADAFQDFLESLPITAAPEISVEDIQRYLTPGPSSNLPTISIGNFPGIGRGAGFRPNPAVFGPLETVRVNGIPMSVYRQKDTGTLYSEAGEIVIEDAPYVPGTATLDPVIGRVRVSPAGGAEPVIQPRPVDDLSVPRGGDPRDPTISRYPPRLPVGDLPTTLPRVDSDVGTYLESLRDAQERARLFRQNPWGTRDNPNRTYLESLRDAQERGRLFRQNPWGTRDNPNRTYFEALRDAKAASVIPVAEFDSVQDVLLPADIFINEQTGGLPGETVSARVARRQTPAARLLADTLDLLDPGHTTRALENAPNRLPCIPAGYARTIAKLWKKRGCCRLMRSR